MVFNNCFLSVSLPYRQNCWRPDLQRALREQVPSFLGDGIGCDHGTMVRDTWNLPKFFGPSQAAKTLGGDVAWALTCRIIPLIIPLSKWSVTPMYKPFKPFGRGKKHSGGLLTKVIIHYKSWDDPPSTGNNRISLSHSLI